MSKERKGRRSKRRRLTRRRRRPEAQSLLEHPPTSFLEARPPEKRGKIVSGTLRRHLNSIVQAQEAQRFDLLQFHRDTVRVLSDDEFKELMILRRKTNVHPLVQQVLEEVLAEFNITGAEIVFPTETMDFATDGFGRSP